MKLSAIRIIAVLALNASLMAAVPPMTAQAQGYEPQPSFSDVADGVHKDNIEALNEMGLFDGTLCGDSMFCPGKPMKRSTMAVWLVRALDGEDPPPVSATRFADVEGDHQLAAFIERFAELGVTRGCKTDPLRYCADDTVTRAQMATFLVRAFGLEAAEPAGFTDTAGGTHAANIDALAAAGFTGGCRTEPLRYCPNNTVTRAQMATFLTRATSLTPTTSPADLSDVCPSPLVVQTDWFPGAEHGAMYHLIGDGYTVDTVNLVVQGPMVLDGTDLGIDFQIRTGGPVIGFAPVSSYMYTDNSIHLGYTSTDAQILQWADAPLVSVVAPLEKNPQMIMWDPETYPNVRTIADLGTEGVTVNVFGGGVFPRVFVAQGIWSADQVDPSYDGSPARFVSEGGAVAQQGFASAEVYTYEHTFEEWGKPVAFQLLHDAGFQIYSQTIGVRPRDIESMRPCLARLVPIIQQAVISFGASPDRANAIIVDAVERYQTFWSYPRYLADFSAQAQLDYGLIGNGPDSTVGNMDADRIQSTIDALLAIHQIIPDELTAEDLFTNEFIDDSVGFLP